MLDALLVAVNCSQHEIPSLSPFIYHMCLAHEELVMGE